MTALVLRLADAPTDVLTYLVDHGPTTVDALIAAVPPPDADRPDLTTRSALRLLADIGYAWPGGAGWEATRAGASAVLDARKSEAAS